MNRTYVSAAAIVAYWIFETLTIAEAGDVPATMGGLLARVMVMKLLILAVILALVRFERNGLRSLGFENASARDVLTGTVFGVGAFIGVNVVVSSVLASVNPAGNTTNPAVIGLLANPANVPAFIFLGIFAGGLVEELERVFMLTRLESVGGTAGLIVALVVGSTVFGLGHLYQGVNSAIAAGVAGLLYAFVFLRKRSAIEAITCHAVYDVIGIVLGHLVYR